MAKYKITHGEVKFSESDIRGVGDVVELSEWDGDAMVASGVAEKVAVKVAEAPKVEPKPAPKVEPKK